MEGSSLKRYTSLVVKSVSDVIDRLNDCYRGVHHILRILRIQVRCVLTILASSWLIIIILWYSSI